MRTVARWLLPQATRAWLRLQLLICRAELFNDFADPDWGPIEGTAPVVEKATAPRAEQSDSEDSPATLPRDDELENPSRWVGRVMSQPAFSIQGGSASA